MRTRFNRLLTAGGTSAVLAAGLILGSAAVASAAPAEPVATVASIHATDRCHHVWHNGYWYWVDRGHWDNHHHWVHHWVRVWHPGWWTWNCR